MLFAVFITAIMASTLPLLVNALEPCYIEDTHRCSGMASIQSCMRINIGLYWIRIANCTPGNICIDTWGTGDPTCAPMATPISDCYPWCSGEEKAAIVKAATDKAKAGVLSSAVSSKTWTTVTEPASSAASDTNTDLAAPSSTDSTDLSVRSASDTTSNIEKRFDHCTQLGAQRCNMLTEIQVCINRGAGIGLVWSHGAYCWEGYFCVQRPPGEPQCIAGFGACFDYCLFGDPGCLKWCQKKQALLVEGKQSLSAEEKQVLSEEKKQALSAKKKQALSAKKDTESTVPSSANTSPTSTLGPNTTSGNESADVPSTKVITAHNAASTLSTCAYIGEAQCGIGIDTIEVCDDDGDGRGLRWHLLLRCSPGKVCAEPTPGNPECIIPGSMTLCQPFCLLGNSGCDPWCIKKVANVTASNETTVAEIDAGSSADTETSETESN